MNDPDDDLLAPHAKARMCIVGTTIERLTPEQQAKVNTALAQPKDKVRAEHILEYLTRKLLPDGGMLFHVDTLRKHRRGKCGCAR